MGTQPNDVADVSQQDEWAAKMKALCNGERKRRRHMWTAPIGKRFFDVLFDLVSFSHMYDLFARHWPLALMKLDCRGPNHCDGFDP